MTIALYDITVPVFRRGLGVLDAVLAKGRAFAEAEGIGLASLLEARLAPDMLTLVGQVQRASDTAKFAAVRIGGVANESFPDDEKSFEDLHDRIARTVAFLDAVPRQSIDAMAGETISATIGRQPVTIGATEYALTFALPNFYFHTATAYGILRHKGVPLGKPDFIGGLG